MKKITFIIIALVIALVGCSKEEATPDYNQYLISNLSNTDYNILKNNNDTIPGSFFLFKRITTDSLYFTFVSDGGYQYRSCKYVIESVSNDWIKIRLIDYYLLVKLSYNNNSSAILNTFSFKKDSLLFNNYKYYLSK